MHVHALLTGPAARFAAGGVLALGVVMAGSAEAAPVVDKAHAVDFGWQMINGGTVVPLSTLDVVSADIVWMGSFESQVLRTVDGGATFTDITPTGFDPEYGLFVQDIEAWSADDALVLAGPDAETTTIYRTTDGGSTWTEVFSATLPAYFNCIGMFDRRHGFAMGDPVDGKYEIVVTTDAGETWALLPNDGMPEAPEGEFGLAFGGDCATATGQKAFFGTWTPAEGPDRRSGLTGGDLFGRIFRSGDYGLTWEVSPTSIPCCVRAIAFRTNRLGLAVGGTYQLGQDNLAARSTDGGATWVTLDDPAMDINHLNVAWWSDARGAERVPDAKKIVFAVGFDSVVSRDRGKTWEQFDDSGEFYNMECVKASPDCWAVGPDGRIAKLVVTAG